MYAAAVKSSEKNKSKAIANNVGGRSRDIGRGFGFVDNRPEAISQRKLQTVANNRPKAKRAAQVQALANSYSAQQHPIQGVFLPTDGKKKDKKMIDQLLLDLADKDKDVNSLQNDKTVQVYVSITRSKDGGDARTTAVWSVGKKVTFILIQLQPTITETDDEIKATLIHELILHGAPAHKKHIAAKGKDPKFTDPEVDEDLFDKEEKIEHADEGRWKQVITTGTMFGTEVWIETCKDLVRHLGVKSELGLKVCLLLQAYAPDFAEIYLQDAEF